MISGGSYTTEDYSNMNNYFVIIFHNINIFHCIFDQINASLVKTRLNKQQQQKNESSWQTFE